MKLLASFLFFLQLSFAFAQSPILVKEESKSMSKGVKNAFLVNVPKYNASKLHREWVKYVRKKTNSKAHSSKTEWNMMNGKMDVLSFDTLSLYTLFFDSDSGATASLFVALKDSFITTKNNPIIADKAKRMMFDFAKSAYIKSVEKELSSEKRHFEQLKDEQERLLKYEDKAIEVVSESKHKIEEDETELEASKEELEIKQKEIFSQKQRALTMSRKSEERKEQNEIVRGMEKDKRNHLKRQQALASEITSLHTRVRTKERYIVSLKAQQDSKEIEIKKQEGLVGSIEKKLATIKQMIF